MGPKGKLEWLLEKYVLISTDSRSMTSIRHLRRNAARRSPPPDVGRGPAPIVTGVSFPISTSSRVVCIAGMHRSGTSLVANLLQTAGVDLGNPQCLMPPRPDNPDGFFEHLEFVRLNDEVLDALGGAWDCPPESVDAVEVQRGLPDLLSQGQELVESVFSPSSVARGWKDPRNSITLPFWAQVVPNLQVVVCVRNPYAVARSLNARNGHSIRFGLDLWRRYHQHLLRNLQGLTYVFVRYETLLANTNTEIARLCAAAIGVQVDPLLLVELTRKIRATPMVQFEQDERELRQKASSDILGLYEQICKLAAGEVVLSKPKRSARVSRRQRATDQTNARIEISSLRYQVARANELAYRQRSVSDSDSIGKFETIRQLPALSRSYGIDFRVGGISNLFVLSGWSHSEAGGTWTDGKEAIILFPAVHVEAARICLTIAAKPFLPPGTTAQEVTLVLNGKDLGQLCVDRPDRWSVQIDPASLNADVNVLGLKIPGAGAPVIFGVSPDRRRLGLYVSSIGLEIAREPPGDELPSQQCFRPEHSYDER